MFKLTTKWWNSFQLLDLDFRLGLMGCFVSLILLGSLIVKFYHSRDRASKNITIRFDHVGMLFEGDAVKIYGVKIGQVVRLKQEDNQAFATVRIDPRYFIPADSRFNIAPVGLMGEREVVVLPGIAEESLDPQMLQEGIFEKGIAEGMEGMGRFVKDFKELVDLFGTLVQAERENKSFVKKFQVSFKAVTQYTLRVEDLLKTHRQQIAKIVFFLSEFSKDVGQFSKSEQLQKMEAKVEQGLLLTQQLNSAIRQGERLIHYLEMTQRKVVRSQTVPHEIFYSDHYTQKLGDLLTTLEVIMEMVEEGKVNFFIGQVKWKAKP